MITKRFEKRLFLPAIAILMILLPAISPDRSLGQTFREGMIGQIHIYDDRISTGAVSDGQGGYPTPDAGGPPEGQFKIESTKFVGLNMYSFANNHTLINQEMQVEYQIKTNLKATAIYILMAGNQLIDIFNNARIATIAVKFTDGSVLDSSIDSNLNIYAGWNIRNFISGKTVSYIFSYDSPDVQNIWYGWHANPNLGHAVFDCLRIPLPEAYHKKRIESIMVKSTHGGTIIGGIVYRPGIRVMGITIPGFRPYPNGFYSQNAGTNAPEIRKLYSPQMIDQGWGTSYETNYWQLYRETFPDTVAAGIPLDANGHIDWKDGTVRFWKKLYGTYKETLGVGLPEKGVMAGGLCYGMAVEAGYLYHETPDITWRPYDLQSAAYVNQLVDYFPSTYKGILMSFARQFGNNSAWWNEYTYWGNDRGLGMHEKGTRWLTQEVRRYVDNQIPFILSVHWETGSLWWKKTVGHTVLPEYIIEDTANNKMYIYFYDNNDPDRLAGADYAMGEKPYQRVMTIDLNPLSASFQVELGGDSINSSTNRQALAYIEAIDDIRAETEVSPANLNAATATAHYVYTVSAGSSGDSSAVFGFTNSSGNSVGNLAGQWYSEIPGAGVRAPLGIVPGQPTPVQEYFLPLDSYTTTITGVAEGSYTMESVVPKGIVSLSSSNTSTTLDALATSSDGKSVSLSTIDNPKPFLLDINRYLDPASSRATWAYTIQNATISPGGSLEFKVNDASGSLTVTNNGPSSTPMEIIFSEGTGPNYGVPASLGNFTVDPSSSISVNSSGGPEIDSVNPVDGALAVPLATTISAAFDREMNRSSVESAFSIVPSVSGSFSWSGNTVTFTPSAALLPNTAYQVTIADTAMDATSVSLSADFTWSFTTLEKKVSITPNGFDFQSVRVNTTSSAKGFAISNGGTANLTIASIGVTGGDGAMFEVSQGSCSSLSPVLSPGQGCEISVTFRPSSIGGKVTTLRILSDATNQPALDVILTGTGVAPMITVSTGSHDFGKVLKGTPSSANGFTITNTGEVDLAVTSIGVTGGDASIFQVTKGSCPSLSPVLGAGASCEAQVVFTPDSKGDKSTTLRIISDALNSPTSDIGLNGKGVDFLVDPEEGTLGTEVTITGEAFGSKKGKVLIGGVALKVVSWATGLIKGAISKVMAVDTPYEATIQRKEPKGAPALEEEDSFTMRKPEIEKVEPNTGTSGGTGVIEITGKFFGTKKGKVYLENGTVMKACKVISWTEGMIQFTVPKKLAAGLYDVTVVNKVDSGRAEGAFTVN